MDTESRRVWAAWLIAGISVLGAVTGVVTLALLSESGRLIDGGLIVAIAAFGLVGAVIVARVPGNRLGWAFGAIGMVMWLGGFQDVARPMLEHGVAPGLVALGQAGADLAWGTGFFIMLVLVPSWFPDGRPLSRKWGWIVGIGSISWAIASFMAVFDAEKRILWEAPDTWRTLRNPIGLSWVPDFEESLIGGLGFGVMMLAGLGAVIGLFIRYRRAGSLARLQIRWLRAALTVFGITILVGVVFGEAFDAAGGIVIGLYDLVFSLAILGIPMAALIAITRNHLYDLGRIVSRTVTYGVVVGGLGLLFAAGAIWLPQRFSAADNNLAIAASTLVVFAAFDPVRRRVQRHVDLRFNRLPYDPSVVSTALTRRLREVIEPGEICAALTSAANENLNPASASIWISGRSGR